MTELSKGLAYGAGTASQYVGTTHLKLTLDTKPYNDERRPVEESTRTGVPAGHESPGEVPESSHTTFRLLGDDGRAELYSKALESANFATEVLGKAHPTVMQTPAGFGPLATGLGVLIAMDQNEDPAGVFYDFTAGAAGSEVGLLVAAETALAFTGPVGVVLGVVLGFGATRWFASAASATKKAALRAPAGHSVWDSVLR